VTDTTDAQGAAIIVLIVVGITVGGLLIYALLRASEKPDPALVVTSLSLLTMTALIGYGFTRLEIMGGLAATGLGALAGAIAGLYRPPPNDPPQRGNDDDRTA
jgi:uncharacterized membrane protein AbrB (regulator of aidB expression)